MDKYAVSWSGGKDCCFAYWKAISRGLKVSYLVNSINDDPTKSMSHGLKPELLTSQAQAIEIPIFQPKVSWGNYETGFKAALEELKLKGITGLIAGDIYLQEHKEWVDRVCSEVSIKAVQPLWRMDTLQLLNDFIKAGFKTIIVSVKSKFLGKEWLGKQLDNDLAIELSQLAKNSNIDPCGEGGEFHTFVCDGPLFKKSVKIGRTNTVKRDDHWFLDILEYGLE